MTATWQKNIKDVVRSGATRLFGYNDAGQAAYVETSSLAKLTDLGVKADKVNAALEGLPTAPTPNTPDASDRLATTAFVKAVVGEIADTRLYETEAAFIAARIPPVINIIVTTGYNTPGDGGGHQKIRIATPSPVQPWHKQSADGSWWEVAEIMPNPRMFGARGDGVTDDSAAIQDADAFAFAKGKTLVFDAGRYLITSATMTAPWAMMPEGVITCGANTRNLGSGNFLLQCAASNKDFGDINVDANASEFWAALFLTGSTNRFKSINIKNIRCRCTLIDNPINRAVVVTGNKNIVDDVTFRDFTEEVPAVNYPTHGLVCEGTAEGNVFKKTTSRNVRGTVVDNSTKKNHYNSIGAYEARGNGFYGVNTGQSEIGLLAYDGADNAAGFRHGHSSQIDTVLISKAEKPGVFFGNCGDVTIASIIGNECATLLLTNQAAGSGSPGEPTTAGNIKIGSIKSVIKNGYPVFFSAGNGPVKSLRIDNFNATITLDDLTDYSLASFLNFGGVDKLEIGKIDFKIILGSVFNTGRTFGLVVKNPLPKRSYFDDIICDFYDPDGETLSTLGCLIGFSNVGQDNLRVSSGLLNTTAGSVGINQTNRRGVITSTGIPTVGTWRIGQIIWALSPTASLRGWICTTSGTPGTWAAF